MFVLTIRNVLEITSEENRTLNLLLRLNYRDEIKKEAANVITSFAKYTNFKYKNKEKINKRRQSIHKEQTSMIKLKRFMNKFSNTQKFY